MTAVVAVEHPGGVWLGCDSFIGSGDSIEEIDRPKIFRKSGLVIGYAGEMRPAQVVEYTAHWRAIKPGEDVQAYLVRVVVEGIGRAYVEGLFETDTRKTDFLVAIRGRAYVIQEDLAVIRSAHGYAAIGWGAQPALVALAATEGKPPRERVLGALGATSKHTSRVRPRFHDVNVPK